MQLPTITPLAALQKLREQGEFTQDKWKFFFSDFPFDESCVSASAVHEDGTPVCTSGTNEEPVTEESYWISL